MPSPPILYKMDASPPARAVMMVAEILGIDIDLRDLNPLLREQDAPKFVKKNPMKTIPIYDEDDFSLADSHAIILYLMDKYSRPSRFPFYPANKRKRATVLQRLFFDCGVLFPKLQAVMGPAYTGKISEMSTKMKKDIDRAYSILEAYLTETEYMADDKITIADISIIATMGTLNGLHPVDERFPKLRQWMENMNKTYYCQKINIPGAQAHVDSIKACMKFTKQNQSKL